VAEFTLFGAPLTDVQASPGAAVPARSAGSRRGRPRPALPRRFVRAIDAALRRFYDIREFSDAPDCLLRIAVVRARRDTLLADGRRVRRGEAVVELHLWNERLAAAPRATESLRRTNDLRRSFAASLRELAEHLAGEPDLGDVAAVRARAGFASRRRLPKLLRVARAYGFQPAWPGGGGRQPGRWSEFAQNLFTCVLTWTFNPAALRGDMLLRSHCDLWVSRDAFIARHGRQPRPAAGATNAGGRQPTEAIGDSDAARWY
jgi:hypothetical protein